MILAVGGVAATILGSAQALAFAAFALFLATPFILATIIGSLLAVVTSATITGIVFSVITYFNPTLTGDLLSGISTWFSSIWTQIQPSLSSAWDTIAATASTLWDSAVNYFNGVWTQIQAAF